MNGRSSSSGGEATFLDFGFGVSLPKEFENISKSPSASFKLELLKSKDFGSDCIGDIIMDFVGPGLKNPETAGESKPMENMSGLP